MLAWAADVALPDPEADGEVELGPWLDDGPCDEGPAELGDALGELEGGWLVDDGPLVDDGGCDEAGALFDDGGAEVADPWLGEADASEDGVGLAEGVFEGAVALADGDDESADVSLSFCLRSKSPHSFCALPNAKKATRATERYKSIFEAYMIVSVHCSVAETAKQAKENEA